MNDIITNPAARQMLAEARTVLEVRDVRDKAEAMRTYARLAKDRDLEISAAEIRVRAERRIGEMLLELKAAGGLPEGRPRKNGSAGEPFLGAISLDDLGVDKKLSMRAQQYANLTEAEFESRLAEWRDQETRRATRAVASLFKAVARPPKPAVTPELPPGRYRVIYADPPWQYETWSGAGKDRSAENHYPTMPTPEICALQVERLAADDCVLLLWATGPMLRDAFVVLEAWGFSYSTLGFVWGKVVHNGSPWAGNGYWTRANAELCLLATRGSPRRREDATNVLQLLLKPRTRHSAKPVEIYSRIEKLLDGPYIELFARPEGGERRKGWDYWGNEAPE